MPVQAAVKMWSRAGSSADATDNFRKLKAGFTEAYQVVHDPWSTEFDIYTAPGLPYVGQPYPGTDFVLAKRGGITRVGPILSIVTINYEGEVAPLNSNGQPAGSPIGNTPLIDWSDVETEEEIDEDWDGNPIITACGEPIRGVKTRIVDDVVTIQRNFLAVNLYARAAYRRATNSDTFLGWPPGTAKIMQLNLKNVIADPQTGRGYWQGTLKVQFRFPYRTTPERAWWARVRHEGFYKRVRVEGPPDQNGNYPFEVVRAVDENKQPVSKPVLLAQTGQQVTDVNQTFWREFKRYGSLPFNALGFI